MSASQLGLLSIQSGQTLNPSVQDGAIGGSSLDVDQRSCDLGAPVPIVFARRRNNKGGILIAPGATEARFENNSVNDVTAYYHLVISEGQVDSIPVKDVLQRSCRVGSHTQTYNRRAGIWIPGNYIVERVGYDKPEASSYCGSVGVYSGMSTLSFQNTVPDGFDQWRKQVHLFIRGGMKVTRLVDSVFGPSDNFADLVLWILKNSSRMPDALIDQPAFLSAATFLEANGFTCNVEIKNSKNISDFIAGWARYFLLGESNNGGKKGLRPLLPTNANGTIKTTAISAEYIFDESLITQGSFSIEYINYADRLPFVAQVTWRQELGTDAAILRTSEIRFVNTPDSGPFESYDLSEFCTSEDHAVKIGAYIVARRALVSHNIRFTARPESHNVSLSPGSIIRVLLSRDSNNEASSVHNYFYQVERITKTLTGEVGYECSHFPIDSEGRSSIAIYVSNAVGNGVLFAVNQTGVTCDLPGRDIDETIPDEEFMFDDDIPGWTWDPDTDIWIPDDDIPGWTWDPDTDEWVLDPLEPFPDPEPDPMPLDPPIDGLDPSIDLPLPDFTGSGADTDLVGGELDSGGEEGSDELDNQEDVTTPSISTEPEGPAVGLPLYVNITCAGGTVQWQRNGVAISGATGDNYTPSGEDIGANVTAQITCPDSSVTITSPVTPFNPSLDYSTYGPVTGKISVVYLARDTTTFFKGSSGNTPVCDTQSVINYSSGSTVAGPFQVSSKVKIRAATVSQVTGQYLSSSITYSNVTCPNTNRTLSRNGVLITTDTAQSETANSVWGSNLSPTTYVGVQSYHYTIITSFVLDNAVPGLGAAGENVIRKGMAHYIAGSSPKDVGITVNQNSST